MRKALLGMALVLSVALPSVAQDKRRVAVLDFGYGTVMTSVQAFLTCSSINWSTMAATA